MNILIFFVSLWYLSLFSQTFLQHRYAAHGAFKMSKGWERFFYILAYITQGSSYMSPKAYAIMHRLHHAYTDTEQDPHSPSFSPNIFHMMWRTRNIYADILSGKIEVEERFLKNLPEWESFDRFAGSTASRLVWMGLYTTFFVVFATSPWQYLLLPVVYAMGAFHGGGHQLVCPQVWLHQLSGAQHIDEPALHRPPDAGRELSQQSPQATFRTQLRQALARDRPGVSRHPFARVAEGDKNS